MLWFGWAALVGLAVMTSGGSAAAVEDWVWPLAGPHLVGRPFEPPTTPSGAGHRGADLPGRLGQPVLAAGAGRVSYAGLLAGRGVVVVVHGELRTTYEPVSALVRVGDRVAAGAVIGRLDAGHAGCVSPCLHWGLLRGDVYLDPVRLVRRGRSRLLPLSGPGPLPTGAGVPLGVPVAARPTAADSPQPAPRPAGQPAFALRAADAGWTAAALAALLAGLALVRRPRPPDDPATPATPALPVAAAASGAAVALPAPTRLVDLAAERHRRRPEVA